MDGLFGIALKKSKTFDSTNKKEHCGGDQEECCNQRRTGDATELQNLIQQVTDRIVVDGLDRRLCRVEDLIKERRDAPQQPTRATPCERDCPRPTS